MAYRSEDLSTAAPCFANEGHGSNFQAVNYTMLQDPPPNSYFAFCDTGDVAISNIGASPMFSYPSDVTNLVPSWSTCTLPHVLGVMDPPHTLNRETVMVPTVSSSTAAAPAAQRRLEFYKVVFQTRSSPAMKILRTMNRPSLPLMTLICQATILHVTVLHMERMMTTLLANPILLVILRQAVTILLTTIPRRFPPVPSLRPVHLP